MASGVRDLRQLLRRTAHGDEHAFLELFDRENRLFYTVAYLAVGEREEAEEMVRKAWVRIRREARHYERGDLSARSWLYHQLFRTARHRLQRFPTLEVGDFLPEIPLDSATVSAQVMALDRLFGALRKMRPIERFLLSLRFLAHLTYDDLAGVVGASFVHMPMRMAYAEKHLADLLDESPTPPLSVSELRRITPFLEQIDNAAMGRLSQEASEKLQELLQECDACQQAMQRAARIAQATSILEAFAPVRREAVVLEMQVLGLTRQTAVRPYGRSLLLSAAAALLSLTVLFVAALVPRAQGNPSPFLPSENTAQQNPEPSQEDGLLDPRLGGSPANQLAQLQAAYEGVRLEWSAQVFPGPGGEKLGLPAPDASAITPEALRARFEAFCTDNFLRLLQASLLVKQDRWYFRADAHPLWMQVNPSALRILQRQDKRAVLASQSFPGNIGNSFELHLTFVQNGETWKLDNVTVWGGHSTT
ncbi:MAG: RNA polymerase sigma factor [Firmicutes bacterium]|nr:RNA polymerase sigma factor [Bacillota bacterium]